MARCGEAVYDDEFGLEPEERKRPRALALILNDFKWDTRHEMSAVRMLLHHCSSGMLPRNLCGPTTRFDVLASGGRCSNNSPRCLNPFQREMVASRQPEASKPFNSCKVCLILVCFFLVFV